MWDPTTIDQDKLIKLRAAAEQAWDDTTRHPDFVGHPQPSAGQCYVTAQWLTTKLGGFVGTRKGHYFWVSPDKNYVIDLAGDECAYPPAHPGADGVQQDDDDEPWEMDEHHKQWRPGPVLFKRASHPLYQGLRIKAAAPVGTRAKRFERRADAALRGEKVARLADLMGDAYPGQEPQAVEDMNNRYMHDEPDFELPSTVQEYKFFYGNGQLHVSPIHDHAELQGHAQVADGHTGPLAVGWVHVDGKNAEWSVDGNVGLRGFTRILKDYTKHVGWRWGGLTNHAGMPVHDDFGPKQSVWYATQPDGTVAISHWPGGQRMDIVGKTAYVSKVNDGLIEWANDFGYKLAEYPGGTNMLDRTRNKEWSELYDLSDPNAAQTHDINQDADPTNLTCSHCGERFPTMQSLILHRTEIEPHETPNEDGHFPNIDAPDAVMPARLRNTQPVAMPLASWKEAARVDGFDLYAQLWGYDTDEDVTHYGAYLNGEIVGYASVRPMSRPDIGEGHELVMIQTTRPGRGVGDVLMNKIKQHYATLWTTSASDQGAKLIQRNGMVNVKGQIYKWAAGQMPKDMLESPVPLIYDIQRDQIHIGNPGAHTADLMVPGQFTPGGIVEGYYEPGGKVVIRTMTNMPWTVRHFGDLWYWSHPQMEITSVELQDASGATQKLASAGDWFAPSYMMPDDAKQHLHEWTQAQQWPEGTQFAPPDRYHVTAIYSPSGFNDPDHQAWAQSKSGMTYPVQTTGVESFTPAPGRDKIPVVVRVHNPNLLAHTNQLLDEAEARGLPISRHGDYKAHITVAHSPVPVQLDHPGMRFNVGPLRDLHGYYDELKQRSSRRIFASESVGPYIKTLTAADPAAWNAYQALRNAGGDVSVVGGAVRDALLGKEPNDLDMMVGGMPPEDVAHALESLPGRVDLTGKKFGVYRYNYKGHEVEIALPRTDKYESGRRGEGQIEVNHKLPIEDDLLRRDFTANSMAVNLDSGKLIDPYGGAQDIADRRLRTTHPSSFAEDPTRLVRALVASSRHGLVPDESTRQEMVQNAHRLSGESGDVIHRELDKLMKSPKPAEAMRMAQETGILKHILPEVANNFDFDQNNPHHNLPLGDHLLNVLHGVAEQSNDPDLRMAGLLHDIGKPDSAWTDPETGFNHYYRGEVNGQPMGANHEDLGAQLAQERLTDLRYPKSRINRITHLIQHHMFPAFSSPKGARKFINRVGDEHADDLLTLRYADQRGKGQSPEEVAARTSVAQQRGLVEQARSSQAPTAPSMLPVNGNDIIAMGVPAGPNVGRVLRQIMDDAIENPALGGNRDALLQRAQEYANAIPTGVS